ncbi:hypothetical protein ACMYSN_19255 [Klebsiella sp. R445]
MFGFKKQVIYPESYDNKDVEAVCIELMRVGVEFKHLRNLGEGFYIQLLNARAADVIGRLNIQCKERDW